MLQLISSQPAASDRLRLVHPAAVSIKDFLDGGKGKKGIYAHSGSGQHAVCWDEELQKDMRPTEIHPDPDDSNQELPIIVFAENILIPKKKEWAVLLAEYSNGLFFIEVRALCKDGMTCFVRSKAEKELEKFLKH